MPSSVRNSDCENEYHHGHLASPPPPKTNSSSRRYHYTSASLPRYSCISSRFSTDSFNLSDPRSDSLSTSSPVLKQSTTNVSDSSHHTKSQNKQKSHVPSDTSASQASTIRFRPYSQRLFKRPSSQPTVTAEFDDAHEPTKGTALTMQPTIDPNIENLENRVEPTEVEQFKFIPFRRTQSSPPSVAPRPGGSDGPKKGQKRQKKVLFKMGSKTAKSNEMESSVDTARSESKCSFHEGTDSSRWSRLIQRWTYKKTSLNESSQPLALIATVESELSLQPTEGDDRGADLSSILASTPHFDHPPAECAEKSKTDIRFSYIDLASDDENQAVSVKGVLKRKISTMFSVKQPLDGDSVGPKANDLACVESENSGAADITQSFMDITSDTEEESHPTLKRKLSELFLVNRRQNSSTLPPTTNNAREAQSTDAVSEPDIHQSYIDFSSDNEDDAATHILSVSHSVSSVLRRKLTELIPLHRQSMSTKSISSTSSMDEKRISKSTITSNRSSVVFHVHDIVENRTAGSPDAASPPRPPPEMSINQIKNDIRFSYIDLVSDDENESVTGSVTGTLKKKLSTMLLKTLKPEESAVDESRAVSVISERSSKRSSARQSNTFSARSSVIIEEEEEGEETVDHTYFEDVGVISGLGITVEENVEKDTDRGFEADVEDDDDFNEGTVTVVENEEAGRDFSLEPKIRNIRRQNSLDADITEYGQINSLYDLRTKPLPPLPNTARRPLSSFLPFWNSSQKPSTNSVYGTQVSAIPVREHRFNRFQSVPNLKRFSQFKSSDMKSQNQTSSTPMENSPPRSNLLRRSILSLKSLHFSSQPSRRYSTVDRTIPTSARRDQYRNRHLVTSYFEHRNQSLANAREQGEFYRFSAVGVTRLETNSNDEWGMRINV
ncbi:hypothetical protein BKA69DRAFT_1168474 [Paraphysoderma sedebokerense]|nr:hypothetical protein BKA69DRAFT_1168474 [Paraphysoderma sedebokerense]